MAVIGKRWHSIDDFYNFKDTTVYTHWVYSISQKVIADILFYNLNFAFKKTHTLVFFYVLHWLENELSVHFF